jgi:hypothetical protein
MATTISCGWGKSPYIVAVFFPWLWGMRGSTLWSRRSFAWSLKIASAVSLSNAWSVVAGDHRQFDDGLGPAIDQLVHYALFAMP